MEKLNYTRKIPLRYETDVFVAGGGPAGVSAAVTAARAGARVLLAELSGTLGGSGTLCGVPELMNFDDGEHFLGGGFGREIYDGLYDKCSYSREWTVVRTEEVKRLYDEKMIGAGVKFLFYTKVTDAVTEDGTLRYAVLSCPDGVCAVRAKIFIDATGSGALSVMSGAGYDYGDEAGVPMAATLCSIFAGVDFGKKREGHDGDRTEDAFRDGVLSQYDTILPGIKPNYPEVGVGLGNIGHLFGADDRSAESLTEAMVHGRAMMKEYEQYYRRYVGGCEHATLIRTSDFLGVRASRRIRTDKMLCARAYFAPGRFADEIGRYSYPIDIHPMTADTQGMEDFLATVVHAKSHGKGESYSIPYGALLVKDTKNLLVAGRAIGTDHKMQASVRVIPGCFITGQAAGMAAAMAAELGVPLRALSIVSLRNALRAAGAYLADDSAPIIKE